MSKISERTLGWIILAVGLVLAAFGAFNLYAEGIAADVEQRSAEMTLIHWPPFFAGLVGLAIGFFLLVRSLLRSTSD